MPDRVNRCPTATASAWPSSTAKAGCSSAAASPRRIPRTPPSSARPGRCRRAASTRAKTPLDTAYRELFEETSIRSVELLAEAPGWIYYDLPDEALGIALKGKYRGQRQRWFAFLLHRRREPRSTSSARAAASIRPSSTAGAGKSSSALPDLIVPFKREAYLQIVAAFADLPARVRGAQTAAG